MRVCAGASLSLFLSVHQGTRNLNKLREAVCSRPSTQTWLASSLAASRDSPGAP